MEVNGIREKERTAYHEAAHAIVAGILGFMPSAIRVMRDGKLRPDGSVERWDAWRGGTDLPDQIMSHAGARREVAVAGFLAEAQWEAIESFGAAALDEMRTMAEFIEQVESWQTGRIEVRVPVVVADRSAEVITRALDADIKALLPFDADALSSALVRARRRLADPVCWSAVAALVRMLLDPQPERRGHSEVVSLSRPDFESLIREIPQSCGGGT